MIHVHYDAQAVRAFHMTMELNSAEVKAHCNLKAKNKNGLANLQKILDLLWSWTAEAWTAGPDILQVPFVQTSKPCIAVVRTGPRMTLSYVSNPRSINVTFVRALFAACADSGASRIEVKYVALTGVYYDDRGRISRASIKLTDIELAAEMQADGHYSVVDPEPQFIQPPAAQLEPGPFLHAELEAEPVAPHSSPEPAGPIPDTQPEPAGPSSPGTQPELQIPDTQPDPAGPSSPDTQSEPVETQRDSSQPLSSQDTVPQNSAASQSFQGTFIVSCYFCTPHLNSDHWARFCRLGSFARTGASIISGRC